MVLWISFLHPTNTKLADFLPLLCWSHTREPPTALFLRAWKAIQGQLHQIPGEQLTPVTNDRRPAPLAFTAGQRCFTQPISLRNSYVIHTAWDSHATYFPRLWVMQMRNRDCRPRGLLPDFEMEVSVETCSASPKCRQPQSCIISFLIQDTDVDGAYDCHTLFLHSLWLLSCKAGWYFPSFLSFSWLHLTPSCVQFFCPHPLASSLLVSVSFLVSRLIHLFPCAT